MKIIKANISDAKELTKLTISSKSYWNYKTKQIEEWREELTISRSYIENHSVYKLVVTTQLVAYYSFINLENKIVMLDNLFVDPKFIGNGFGKFLLKDFINRVKRSGFNKIRLESDPNAEAFYLKYGFKVVGKKESSIKNRFLPIMEMEI